MNEIALSLKTTSFGKDCYKILLGTVCDLKSTWVGDSAQWFDECKDSSKVEIQVMNKQIAPAT